MGACTSGTWSTGGARRRSRAATRRYRRSDLVGCDLGSRDAPQRRDPEVVEAPHVRPLGHGHLRMRGSPPRPDARQPRAGLEVLPLRHCKRSALPVEELDRDVLHRLRTMVPAEDMVELARAELHRRPGAATGDDARVARARIETRIEKLKSQHEWGDLEDDEYRTKMRDAKPDLAKLKTPGEGVALQPGCGRRRVDRPRRRHSHAGAAPRARADPRRRRHDERRQRRGSAAPPRRSPALRRCGRSCLWRPRTDSGTRKPKRSTRSRGMPQERGPEAALFSSYGREWVPATPCNSLPRDLG